MLNYSDAHFIEEILEEYVRSCEQFLNNTMCIYNSDIGTNASAYWEANVRRAQSKFERAKGIHGIFITEFMEYFTDAY